MVFRLILLTADYWFSDAYGTALPDTSGKEGRNEMSMLSYVCLIVAYYVVVYHTQ